MPKNYNCDGDNCKFPKGEIRTLPLSDNLEGGNLLLCKECYQFEIAWRKDANKTLNDDVKFDLPTWESLKVYPEQ